MKPKTNIEWDRYPMRKYGSSIRLKMLRQGIDRGIRVKVARSVARTLEYNDKPLWMGKISVAG